jgi:hypothetical protein
MLSLGALGVRTKIHEATRFIALLGGTAVARPMAARAQQPGGPGAVGILVPFPDDRDPLVRQYLSAFKQRPLT